MDHLLVRLENIRQAMEEKSLDRHQNLMHADFFLLLKKEVGPKIEARDTKAQEISVLQATAHNKQERLVGISIC